jgi:hypothetical protein
MNKTEYLTQKQALHLLADTKFRSKLDFEKTGSIQPIAIFYRPDEKIIRVELDDTIAQRIQIMSMAFDAIAVAMVWETDDRLHIDLEWRNEMQEVRRVCSRREIIRGSKISLGKEQLKPEVQMVRGETIRGSKPSQREIDGAQEITWAQDPIRG